MSFLMKRMLIAVGTVGAVLFVAYSQYQQAVLDHLLASDTPDYLKQTQRVVLTALHQRSSVGKTGFVSHEASPEAMRHKGLRTERDELRLIEFKEDGTMVIKEPDDAATEDSPERCLKAFQR